MAENNSSPMTQPENIQAAESTPVAVAEPNPAAGTPNGTAPTTPVKPKKIKKKTWFARHKVLTIILVLILALVGFFTVNSALAAKKNTATTYQYIRTTTLKKTTLSNSVSVTGTVASGSVASVTVADTAKTYKVATVDVQVGDKVNNGDVICTLDTTDLEKSIASAQQSYNDTLTAAQLAYTRAQDDYNTAVTDHENKLLTLTENVKAAQDDLDKANADLKTAQDSYDSATSKYNSIKSAYDTASANINTFTANVNAMQVQLNSYLGTLNGTIAQYNAMLANCQSEYALNNSEKPAHYDALCAAATDMLSAYYQYNANGTGTSTTVSGQTGTTITTAAGNKTDVAVIQSQVNAVYPAGGWVASYSDCEYSRSALGQYEAAAKSLADAQSSCSSPALGLTGFTAIETALTQADTTKSAASKTLDAAKATATAAETKLKTASNSYDDEKNGTTLKAKKQQIEDAALKLTQAKRTPDNMTTLQDTVAKCTLTATMSGTITALNATVGSVCSGTVATIQDTDGLTVSVTIPSNDVVNLTTGMNCNITSDATGDKTINGTLTQIDPVANDKGSFGAKVTVSGDPDKLLIGMQAKVEIFESTADNVFVVPLDAVGTAEDGTSFVRRKTGGTGVDMTFEEITVTTGASNDYNVEISADTLAEGDVIRASADLTVGTETTDATTDPFGEMAVAQTGGEAPQDGGTPPDGGGAGGGPQGGGQ